MNSKCDYELLRIIVKSGQGSKVLKFAKKRGADGGTIILGKGTINKPLLKVLELDEIKSEVVMMVVEKELADYIASQVYEKFSFQKRNKGIIFSTRLRAFLGYQDYDKECKQQKEEESMYNAIYIIVDKGKGEDVLKEATKAGANGATIIKGRGSGIHEHEKFFNMEIEPEKEIIMIIAKKEKSEKITRHISEKFDIDKPGKGIIFVQSVSKAYGVREN